MIVLAVVLLMLCLLFLIVLLARAFPPRARRSKSNPKKEVHNGNP